MDQEDEALEATRRAAAGRKGPAGSVQRLAWVLYGASGWRIRAIVREEEIELGALSPTVTRVVLAVVAAVKVRHILKTYLADLETVMMLTNSTSPKGGS